MASIGMQKTDSRSPESATAWQQAFSPEVQHALAEEDRQAWVAICTVLISIVTLGLIIGAAAVAIILG